MSQRPPIWFLMILHVVHSIHQVSALGYNILLISDDMPSHILVLTHLGLSLTERGHKVTIVTSSAVNLSSFVEHGDMLIEQFDNPDDPYPAQQEWQDSNFEYAIHPSDTNMKKILHALEEIEHYLGMRFYGDRQLHDKLHSADFDFVVVDGGVPPYLAYAYKQNIPYAIFDVKCMPAANRIPSYPSFVPIWSQFAPKSMKSSI